jgi:hypothetical protein
MKLKHSRMSLLAACAATGLVAAGTLTFGITSALFSDSASSDTNAFAAGTVTVAPGDTPSVTCNVTNMMPGDSSTGYDSGSDDKTPCAFNVKYTGSGQAWLGVDVTVNGGTPSLFTGASTGLQLKINAGSVAIVNGVTYKDSAGTDTTVVADTAVTNVLVSGTPAATNQSVTFDIDYLLPLLVDNSRQGSSASVSLTFRAVQSANQPIGSCVAGRQCSAITWG